jgi:hypothetical protein
MEVINNLIIGTLEFKITSDKLFIQSPSGQETYALRSINGISVKDNIELFNNESNQLKLTKNIGIGVIVFGVLCAIILIVKTDNIIECCMMGAISFVLGYFIYSRGRKTPRMQSIVNIAMNSGVKYFSFFKDDANAQQVADFVAALEGTLTSFHKNN